MGLRLLTPRVAQLTKLRNLTLWSSVLDELPDSSWPSKSETLDLKCPDLIILPAHLHRLSNLTTLNLDCSSLRSRPPELLEPREKSARYVWRSSELNIAHEVEKMDLDFTRLSSSLRCFQFSGFYQHLFLTTLAAFPCLEELTLQSCTGLLSRHTVSRLLSRGSPYRLLCSASPSACNELLGSA